VEKSRKPSKLAAGLVALSVFLAGITISRAHPGSSIVVDAQRQVYFVDTGRGVWKLDSQGRLTLIHTVAYHWMALDEKGHFAKSNPLGQFDRGSFERITPPGDPTLIIFSDYPITVGQDGALYYVPYNPDGGRELIRRMPSNQRSVFAKLPTDTSPKPMLWVNGITTGPDGTLYITDNDAVRKINDKGNVTTFRDAIRAPDCAAPLPDTPKLPYLRGLAVHSDGTIYAAANGCRTVIQIPAKGRIRTVLKAEPPWSPTSVAIAGKEIYVLEYLHTPGDNRIEWTPRVRRIGPDGRITTLATINRQRDQR
jgi:hypothetical protein